MHQSREIVALESAYWFEHTGLYSTDKNLAKYSYCALVSFNLQSSKPQILCRVVDGN